MIGGDESSSCGAEGSLGEEALGHEVPGEETVGDAATHPEWERRGRRRKGMSVSSTGGSVPVRVLPALGSGAPSFQLLCSAGPVVHGWPDSVLKSPGRES